MAILSKISNVEKLIMIRATDTGPDVTQKAKVFGAEDIPEIVKWFEEADGRGDGGLNMEEFCAAMKKKYGDLVSKDELMHLYMKIDTNCDKKVDLSGLLTFLFGRNIATQGIEYRKQPFPKTFTIVPVDCFRSIVRLLFLPAEDTVDFDIDSKFSEGKLSPYQKGHYISISSNGMLNFWSDKLKKQFTFALNKRDNVYYSKIRKKTVVDMLYMKELTQVAIATSENEIIFFELKEYAETLTESQALVNKGDCITAINYWCDGTKSIFSFGDEGGYLSVFISLNVKAWGLFCNAAYEKFSHQKYPTVHVTSLLRNLSQDFMCFRVHTFAGVCAQIRYCPSIDSFTICSKPSKTMLLMALPKTPKANIAKMFYKSTRGGGHWFFNCVDYSPSVSCLLSGGTDGLLRVWFTFSTTCVKELKGHVKPVTHILYNQKDKTFFSLSEEKNIRVWSENGWLCLQSLQVQDMGSSPISSICYNKYNNEIVVANSNIAHCLGRGTKVFKAALTSHEMPLCGILYHSIFKQIISVCQNGVATVWDVLTGKAVVEFSISPETAMGRTAIAFDGPQRRLITVSQDGKLRLWNFNSGTELAVIPVILPKEVTGIVCMDNRIFVSARNSNLIFNLNIKGCDHMFWKHDFLKDISSMDVHGNKLLTASTNGNVVAWDIETAETLYYLNTNTSPRTHRAFPMHQGYMGNVPIGQKMAADAKKVDVNISPLMLCLKTRVLKVEIATMLTASGGFIYAWSVVRDGGLLGKYKAVEDDNAVITAMTIDVKEKTLLSGDSHGMIYLWDIQNFGFKRKDDKGPFEDTSGWRVSLSPPPLLKSWKCHVKGLVGIQYDPACNAIVTAGLDCNVKLWTNTGYLIGLFGKDEWDPETKHTTEPISESLRPVTQGSLASDSAVVHKKVDDAPHKQEPEVKTVVMRRPKPKSELLKLSDDQLIAYCRNLLWKKPTLKEKQRATEGFESHLAKTSCNSGDTKQSSSRSVTPNSRSESRSESLGELNTSQVSSPLSCLSEPRADSRSEPFDKSQPTPRWTKRVHHKTHLKPSHSPATTLNLSPASSSPNSERSCETADQRSNASQTGSDSKRSPYQIPSPYSNQGASKPQVAKVQQRDTVKECFVNPCPSDETLLRPGLPQRKRLRGSSDHHQTITQTTHSYLDHNTDRVGQVLKVPRGETMKESFFKLSSPGRAQSVQYAPRTSSVRTGNESQQTSSPRAVQSVSSSRFKFREVLKIPQVTLPSPGEKSYEPFSHFRPGHSRVQSVHHYGSAKPRKTTPTPTYTTRGSSHTQLPFKKVQKSAHEPKFKPPHSPNIQDGREQLFLLKEFHATSSLAQLLSGEQRSTAKGSVHKPHLSKRIHGTPTSSLTDGTFPQALSSYLHKWDKIGHLLRAGMSGTEGEGHRKPSPSNGEPHLGKSHHSKARLHSRGRAAIR
ncbi:cilia- and flagella-associated protein 337-like [Nelusetta ayraudi]|uniref:cilia- and flagella-associated protein 337-like n=1 Tax=Nelusetta ayraudi TaxID=303726 RepID=UPI003F703ED9